MDLHTIQNRILTLSSFIKKIDVTIKNNSLYAIIYPDFMALKKENIINIESEIHWYGVELYNMEVADAHRIVGYEIIPDEVDIAQSDRVDDELYLSITTFIATLSSKKIYFDSHLELDIGLDSLDYVELFVFIEESFGVVITEVEFSKIMIMKEFYEYVKKYQIKFNPVMVKWKDILEKEQSKKLIYSPFLMSLYKMALLPFFKLYFSLEVKGRENILQTPCIIAPIHQSMLDGFLIVATLPLKVLKRSFFISFKQNFGRGFLKPMAEHGQNILIDANIHLKETMQYSRLALKEDDNLVIFPEGARTRDGKLLEFRPFYSILSHTYNVPIIPVVFRGSFEAFRSGTTLPLPKKISITYLKPIYPEGLSYDEINTKVREAIEMELALK